jgi:hypothetical protein
MLIMALEGIIDLYGKSIDLQRGIGMKCFVAEAGKGISLGKNSIY